MRALAYPAQAFDSWASIAPLAANDFEEVVSTMHAGVATVLPPLRAAAATLREAQGIPAIGMMSGSGATCFLLQAGPDATLPPSSLPARVIATHTA